MSVAQDWKSRKLTDLAEYINGYAFKPEDWDKHGLPIIRIEQLKNPDSISDYFSGRLPEHNIIDNNDLIFSWSASLFLSIWKGGKAALNQHLFKVIEKEGVDRHFLKHFIEFYLPEIAKVSHGSTMQHITRKELDQFRAVFPCNKSEQIKIADILSTVDQAIEQTEALIAKQKRIKIGLVQDLLTRGIDEDGNLRSENTWPIRKLRDIADIRVSNVDKKVHKTETPVRLCNYMDVYVNDYITNEIDFMQASASTTEIQRFSLQRGDVIITKDSETPDDIGVPAVVSDEIEHLVCGYHLCLIRPNTGDLNPIYLSKQLATSKIVQYFAIHANGSTRFGLPINAIENIALPFPPRSEQMMIAKILFTADKVIEQTGALLAEQQRIKTGLMQDLLTGQVSVTPLLTKAETST